MRWVLRDRSDKAGPLRAISSLDLEKPYSVEIKQYQESRSLAQNRLLWMWLDEIRHHCHDTGICDLYASEVWKERFQRLMLPVKVMEVFGEVIHVSTGTSELRVREFSEFLEKIEMYAAQELHLEVTRPDDLYWKAMLREN